MVRYSLIVDYLDRGNNFSQVARLCCCSRMTVWRVVQRLDSIKIETIDLKHITIVLNMVLTKDKFQNFENFEKFTNTTEMAEMTVQFKTEVTGQTSKIYARFQDSSVIYYLQISTASEISAENKLNQYISNII